MKPWKKLRSRIHAANDHWEYYIDDFMLDDRQEREYHYVHTGGSTMIIPLLPGKMFLLTKQFRYLNQVDSLEFPCGAIQKGLSAEQNALKELQEETGYSARELTKIGEFTPYTGASDEICHLFIAENLFESPLPPDDTEDIELVTVTLQELDGMVVSNQIRDGLTLAAWSLSQLHLRERLHV
ncbi:MAG: NUDIX hydrolase [Ignavibacteriales bacterium]|nr:NUDIX hydrolase [Ignavibacteriales bacterium]